MKKIFIISILSFFTTLLIAQPGAIDPDFNNSAEGHNNPLKYTTVIQPDGKILIGGTSNSGIVRLNQNGTKDYTFDSGTGHNQIVRTMAIQEDGKILVGGNFTTYNNVAVNRMVRLNSDGTIDNTFNVGTGFNAHVLLIVVQEDGKILVGGSFTDYNNEVVNRIMRLNSDGTRDNTFNIGTGFDDAVNAIVIQEDGKILVGGSFTTYNDETSNRMVRLNVDGTIDHTFDLGTGFNSQVHSIVIQENGQIVVGGQFTNYNDEQVGIVRLNPDGTRDYTFNCEPEYQYQALAIQEDGKILVVGIFSIFNGFETDGVVRLNSDGTIDNSFVSETGASNFAIISVAIQENEKILIGGIFANNDEGVAYGIIRLDQSGARDNTFAGQRGFNDIVSTIVVQEDGKILVGGHFTSYNSESTGRIIRLNENGLKDHTFDVGTGADETVHTIAVQSDGKIIIGGAFYSYNGEPCSRIVRLNQDGTRDNTFNIGAGFNSYVYSIVIQDDGKIIVGGAFTSYKGVAINRIVRLNINGTIDNTFNVGTGFNDHVRTISIQDDGKILAGGYFTSFNGETVNRIVRLNTDGTRDDTFSNGTGFDDVVFSFAFQEDGKIVAVGYFTAYNGETTNRIIRLNDDGTKDESFNIGTGFNSFGASSVVIQEDGKIIVGGNFIFYDGTMIDKLVRINQDGTIDNTFNIGTGFSDDVMAIALQEDGKVLVGGFFTSYDNSINRHIVRLLNHCDTTYETDVVSTCVPFTWIDGNEYTESNNTATWTITNANGCDHVVTLDLTIQNETSETIDETACESYTWEDGNQETYTESGAYTWTTTNASGCDHIVTLDLTINHPTSATDEISSCDDIVWLDGITYTSSNNTATYTTTNENGCTHVITLDYVKLEATTETFEEEACDSYFWEDGNGETYTESGTYTWTTTNANGCDHIVTLNLTINESTSGTDVINTTSDDYTWIDGITYTEDNNTATWTLMNEAGCDSVVTLNLTFGTCTMPIIQNDVIGKTTASFNWNGSSGVEQYQVRYKIQGASVNWFIVNLPGNVTSTTLTGLAPDTDYYISIRSKCEGSSEYGSWMPIDVVNATQGQFHTEPLDGCDDAPATITANEITTSSMKINWSAVANISAYNLRYKAVGAAVSWTYVELDETTTSYTLTNLSVNTSYYVQIRTKCQGFDDYSILWSNAIAFTTEDFGPCDAPPSPLSVDEETSNAVLLSWNAIPSAEMYDFRYKKVGVGGWMHKFVPGDQESTWLTGLASNVSYYVQVSTKCEGSSIYGNKSPAITVTPQGQIGGSGLVKYEDNFSADEVKVNNKISISNGMEVIMYPNPTSGMLNVDVALNSIELGNIQIHIYDMSGRIVSSTYSHLESGFNNVRINLGELSTGLYNVVLYNDNVAIYRDKIQKN